MGLILAFSCVLLLSSQFPMNFLSALPVLPSGLSPLPGWLCRYSDSGLGLLFVSSILCSLLLRQLCLRVSALPCKLALPAWPLLPLSAFSRARVCISGGLSQGPSQLLGIWRRYPKGRTRSVEWCSGSREDLLGHFLQASPPERMGVEGSWDGNLQLFPRPSSGSCPSLNHVWGPSQGPLPW